MGWGTGGIAVASAIAARPGNMGLAPEVSSGSLLSYVPELSSRFAR